MGLMRVFSKSIRFTVRAKRRFIVFMLIFAIVSSFVAFFISSLDDLQTDEFLEQKGVVLEQFGEYSVTYNQSQKLAKDILQLQSSGKAAIENHAIYNFIDLDPTMRIFSMDVANPWMSQEINPSYIQTGRFPKAANEIMIPSGSFQYRNSSNNIRLKTDLVIGQTIQFTDGTDTVEVVVVGTFDNTRVQIPLNITEKLWMFMDNSKFEDVVDLYGLSLNDAYTLTMSFIVPGLFLMKETYEMIDNLNTEIKKVIANGSTVDYGEWRPQPLSLPLDTAKEDADFKLLLLIYAVGGGMLLSIFFSYLISRFRRPEIAVLKALGYSNRAVRISLVGEILTTAFIGFAVGLSSAQAFLFFPGMNRNSLLRIEAVTSSFIINVIISLPGVLLVSRRILKISPAEAFRDK